MNLPYAGALLPAEAYVLMQSLPEAKLVDVRTRAELDWVGQVPGSVKVEWNTWPRGGSRAGLGEPAQPADQFTTPL